MADQVKPDANQASTHDAQLTVDSMASGEEKAAKVDFEADYAAAQEFSVSEIDRTNEGAAAATAATAPKQKVPEVKETKTQAQSTGNPEDYVEMAKELGGSRTEAVTNVSDDLIEKAFKKGQSKQ
ncbi:hypothetical protein [Nodularia sphaerocarpa]|uniref:hypothetical protein n=1 Tax=Nodularia sphaerocarpa TaxID=137816 RepID=UPI001EFC2C31|nr:hypothetical protein [Nodularia sphaerocarpa]MDB9373972.1 hypothetical protein [Nodularia sphaerocarpa CS-585]MDB9376369.1 hypothetical protein [Nodularia sphaerocarpa CS-585A2]ULP73741.1 hypothetical protein BDGGKGIB_03401 [Nodularia sphaerocarpa UHCC 0038]